MSEGSLIGWLGQPGYTPWTLNVGIGCTVRSTGCELCYAPKWAIRQAHYPGRDGIVTKDALGRLTWTGKVITFPERLAKPRKVQKPHMIFLNALMELFDPQVDEEFLVALWQMMADTPQHIYVILSKLPKRMHDAVSRMVARFGVLPNLWLGASAENQHEADIRIPWLIRTPAAIRAVSCEPLLSAINLRPWLPDWDDDLEQHVCQAHGLPECSQGCAELAWVIVGGEAGRKEDARPMHPAWARDLLGQAAAAHVAGYFKQWGNWGPAPWRVPIPEHLARAYAHAVVVGDTSAVEEEVAAAKKESERVAATHAYPVWADQYEWMKIEASHKPWSLERTTLPATHAPIRFYPGKSAGHELDGRTWQQWPI